MHKSNKINMILLGCFALLLAGPAMADPATASPYVIPTGSPATPAPTTSTFPATQSQFFQNMQQQWQQTQQAYITNNSLNPANYNLPPMPAPVPTPPPVPVPAPNPTPGGAMPTPNLPNPPVLQN